MASRPVQCISNCERNDWNCVAPRAKPLDITSIVAREVDPRARAEPVIWRLLTNRPAETCEAVVELIDWYRARWEIEMLFHMLENAWRIEVLQLEHTTSWSAP